MAKSDAEIGMPYDSSVFEGPAVRKKREVPDGLWMRCAGCESILSLLGFYGRITNSLFRPSFKIIRLCCLALQPKLLSPREIVFSVT